MTDAGSTEQGDKGVSRSSEITPSSEHGAKEKTGNKKGFLHRFTRRTATDSPAIHDERKMVKARIALARLGHTLHAHSDAQGLADGDKDKDIGSGIEAANKSGSHGAYLNILERDSIFLPQKQKCLMK